MLLGTPFLYAESSEAKDERPNVLIAFADDWGRYASAYAALQSGTPSDVVSTPNFDAIAKRGVLMTSAFVNAPSCTPCRSSFLSGQSFFRCDRGAILQGAIWDDSIPTFPLMLRDAGYHIGFTYKVWSPGKPADAPFGGKAHAYAKRGGQFNGFSQFVSRAENIEEAKEVLYQQVLGNFEDFLNARPDGQPFCYWFGPTNCHRTWIKGSGKTLWGIDPDSLKGKLPPFLPDVPEVREDFADYLGEVQAFDAGLGVLLKRLEESGELDNTIVIVSGDHGIPGFPRGKCNLYDFGVHVPLAIQWPKSVPGGRVVTDFVSIPDLAPTILEAAGITPPSSMNAKSLLNVLQSSASGRVNADRNFVVAGRERHVAGVRKDYVPYPQRSLRTDGFLYIRNFEPDRWPMGEAVGHGRPDGEWPDEKMLSTQTYAAFGDMDASPTKAWVILNGENPQWAPYFRLAFDRRPGEELYDLKSDPNQVQNVADDPKYATVKEQLAQQLQSYLSTAQDPRVVETPPRFERPPFTDPMSRN